MLLIHSALESPLPCTNTTGGGPDSAPGWRGGGAAGVWRCCLAWATMDASAGHSAAAPPSKARRVGPKPFVLSPPDIGPHVGKCRRPTLRLRHVHLLRQYTRRPSGARSGSRRRDRRALGKPRRTHPRQDREPYPRGSGASARPLLWSKAPALRPAA